ncbi:hypothetical protein INT48_007198, partial [Thamnidium elegans]
MYILINKNLDHAEFMHQVPDDYLADIMPLAKKIAAAGGFAQYNVLQNNGKLANQAVPHVHFHIIPKPDQETGLGVRWIPLKKSMDDIKVTYNDIIKKLRQIVLVNKGLNSPVVNSIQQRQLSMWKLIPKLVLATTSKSHRKYIVGALGAASVLSSFLGPVVWVAAGGAASIFGWRLIRKTQNWWDYLAPVISKGKDIPSITQAILSQVGTHRAAELVRIDAIKELKNFFENTKQGKEMLQAFGLDHFRDLTWEDVHQSSSIKDGNDKHKVKVNFWLEDQTSKGPKGGGCEVTASATISGKGKIDLDQVKLSSPGWHKDEVIPLT